MSEFTRTDPPGSITDILDRDRRRDCREDRRFRGGVDVCVEDVQVGISFLF